MRNVLHRWFRRRVSDREIDAELTFHLEQEIAARVRAGQPPEEARRASLLDFGGSEGVKEACRDHRPFVTPRMLVADVKYALRRFRQAPGFTAIAVLSLALGIGANTALFSLVNVLLLRLIPVERPQELVWFSLNEANGRNRILNYPFYEQVRDHPAFQGVLCAFPTAISVSTGATTERIDGELVSGTYFPVLGVRPYLGRLLAPEDDRTRLGHPVAVVSHAYWQSRLGADRNAVGRVIHLNGSPYTVIGVSQPGFSGIEQGHPHSIFVPMHMKAQITPGWDGLDKPLIAWLWIAARVKQAPPAALATELNARLHAFQKPHVDADKRLTASQREYIQHRSLHLEPLRDAVLDARMSRHLRTLGWVVGILLLLTCVNLAGLLLARGLERQKEFATRLALGASRSRLILQLLVESTLLSLAGGFAGLALGGLVAPVLANRYPLLGQGSTLAVPMDLSVFAFTLVVSMLASMVFGLVPAWVSSQLDFTAALKGAAQGLRMRRIRYALVGGQVALALVLLVGAGLFATNLHRLLTFNTGFSSRSLLIAEIEPMLRIQDDMRRLAMYRQLDGRLLAAAHLEGSGFSQAALSNVAPMGAWTWSSLFLVDGRDSRDRIPQAVAVGQGYFTTMGIPLRRGRLLDERDDRGAPRSALISESLARRVFPDSDPIGRRFVGDYRERENSTFEIVGVVGDVDLNDPRSRASRECVYVPYRQWPFTPQAIVIQARITSPGAVPAATATIRRIVRDLDPGMPVYDVRTIETAMNSVLAAERMAATLTGFFAALAVLLVAVGVYGTLAREVAARRREIGIRLALGASRTGLVWTLVRETILCAISGIGAGALALIALRPWIQPLLTDVPVWEPSVIAGALSLLLSVSGIACLLPGRKAVQVDPAVAVRWE